MTRKHLSWYLRPLLAGFFLFVFFGVVVFVFGPLTVFGDVP